MVLNLILASICIEKNWGEEKILVIPVTWQISAQPLTITLTIITRHHHHHHIITHQGHISKVSFKLFIAETVINVFPLCASMESRYLKYGASHDSNDTNIENADDVIIDMAMKIT